MKEIFSNFCVTIEAWAHHLLFGRGMVGRDIFLIFVLQLNPGHTICFLAGGWLKEIFSNFCVTIEAWAHHLLFGRGMVGRDIFLIFVLLLKGHTIFAFWEGDGCKRYFSNFCVTLKGAHHLLFGRGMAGRISQKTSCGILKQRNWCLSNSTSCTAFKVENISALFIDQW